MPFGPATKYFQLRRVVHDQWLPSDKLRQIQTVRLKRIIKHAYQNVPYYHDLFKLAGITPEDIKEPEDLLKIPITTKKDLKNQPLENLLAQNIPPENIICKKTSGSTGMPLTICFEKHRKLDQVSLWYRLFLSQGMKPRDKILRIFGDEPPEEKKNLLSRLGLFRKRQISSFRSLRNQTRVIQEYQPEVLIGEPSALYLLAKHLEKHRIKLPYPKLVVSSTEILHSYMRKIINKDFRTKVFDVYVALELGIIAFECQEHQGYHLNIDFLISEVLKNGKTVSDGQTGYFVGTNLFNFAMPFIRYNLGDLCIPTNKVCSCGRKLPLISSIAGRDNDLLIKPDGTVISSGQVVNVVHQGCQNVREFKLIQTAPDLVLLKIVKDRGFDSAILNKIREEFTQYMGGIKLDIEVVAEIYPDKSGKRRVFSSKVLPKPPEKGRLKPPPPSV